MDAAMDEITRANPPGTVWVCAACGKWWRGQRMAAPDTSCFLHAVLCHETDRTEGKLRGRETEGWVAWKSNGDQQPS